MKWPSAIRPCFTQLYHIRTDVYMDAALRLEHLRVFERTARRIYLSV